MADAANGTTRRSFMGAAAAAGMGLALPPARAQGSGPAKVMIVRHAEKPARDGKPPFGLDPDGRHDVDALLVEGWQRAGALARLMAPHGDAAMPAGLARPTFLFAAAATPEHPSKRSMLTLSPLAALTGLTPDTSYGPDREREAAAAILRHDGVGLVAWEHKRIADLVEAVTGGAVAGPHWPGRRFDMVLVLDRDGPRWRLTQVPQMLLGGDSAAPLPARKGDGAEAD